MKGDPRSSGHSSGQRREAMFPYRCRWWPRKTYVRADIAMWQVVAWKSISAEQNQRRQGTAQ